MSGHLLVGLARIEEINDTPLFLPTEVQTDPMRRNQSHQSREYNCRGICKRCRFFETGHTSINFKLNYSEAKNDTAYWEEQGRSAPDFHQAGYDTAARHCAKQRTVRDRVKVANATAMAKTRADKVADFLMIERVIERQVTADKFQLFIEMNTVT